jgi:thiosulfate/3-mercaptopyruvate sulfurtransferase
MYNIIIKGGTMRLRRKISIGIVSLLFVMSLFAGYQNTYASGAQPLVETQWLADNLSNVKVVFVDNWPSDIEEYKKKHIKGSVKMGVGKLFPAFNPPNKVKFEGMMKELGISNGDHVVLYGAKGQSVFTLGAFWLMQYFGHDNVSFLNGGLAKWNSENRPSEAGASKESTPGNYKAGSPDGSIKIAADEILSKLENKNVVIVDARGTEFYTGDTREENVPRVGHIPGALDLGYNKTNFNDDGTVKSAADLKSVYESNGVTKDKEVIAYCQGGIKASNTYFTLKHILGYPNVKVYVGSWKHWSKLDFNKYPIVGKIVEEKKQ